MKTLALCLLCPVLAFGADTARSLSYLSPSLAFSPSNMLRSNLLAGVNVTIDFTNGGKAVIHAPSPTNSTSACPMVGTNYVLDFSKPLWSLTVTGPVRFAHATNCGSLPFTAVKLYGGGQPLQLPGTWQLLTNLNTNLPAGKVTILAGANDATSDTNTVVAAAGQ